MVVSFRTTNTNIFSLKLRKIYPSITILWLGTSFFAGYLLFNQSTPLSALVVTFSLLLSIQAFFTLFWMLYAWDDPRLAVDHKSPTKYLPAKYSFTAMLPARHEAKVIAQTIASVNNIKYPEHLKQILILIREDDVETLKVVKQTLKELSNPNIRLVSFNDFPINKPHSLNLGLTEATKQIVTIFDAEDQPHPDIYQIINTVMVRDSVDVVQSGVQLMNFNSRWFSAPNILEYFFWFKSGLHFFHRLGHVALLGGNTVFFKRDLLNKVGGWDETCLTEDAEIGFRLASIGAKFKIIYDEQHVTREEAPTSVATFVKQRTRWNHGFLQILFKPDWLSLPLFRQRLFAFYVLLSPILQLTQYLYLPIGIYIALTKHLSVSVAMFSFIPYYLSLLEIVVSNIGLFEFTKSYKFSYSLLLPIRLTLSYVPYQTLLMIASVRAITHFIFHQNAWEKTEHTNAHRHAKN